MFKKYYGHSYLNIIRLIIILTEFDLCLMIGLMFASISLSIGFVVIMAVFFVLSVLVILPMMYLHYYKLKTIAKNLHVNIGENNSICFTEEASEDKIVSYLIKDVQSCFPDKKYIIITGDISVTEKNKNNTKEYKKLVCKMPRCFTNENEFFKLIKEHK